MIIFLDIKNLKTMKIGFFKTLLLTFLESFFSFLSLILLESNIIYHLFEDSSNRSIPCNKLYDLFP